MKNKYLVIIIFAATLFIPFDYAVYFFPATIIYLIFLDIHLFKFVRKLSFLMLVFILILLQPIVLGEKDYLMLGIKISTNGFYNGLIMILRAVVMIPAINYLSKTSDRRNLQKLFARLGIRQYDEILDHSQKLFPLLKEKTKEFFTTVERKKIFSPIEFTAHFLAFLIKATTTYTPKTNKENAL